MTDDPDTIFFGGHMAIHPQSFRRLRIEPSLELGIGDYGPFDVLTLRGNVNFKFFFPVGSGMAFYPLLGPSLYYINLDDCVGDCSDTEIGLNLGMGFEFNGFAFDITLGFDDDDLPDIALTFLYTFY